MSSELYMECEEEELEPWQREICEEDEEEMDVFCGLKQEMEFVNGPGLAVPTPPLPTLLQAAPLIGSSFAQGVSLIGSSRSQGLSLIGSSITQGTSVIGSNLAPVMSVIGPNVPTGTSVIGSKMSQTRPAIGSNITPGTFAIGSNVTTITPVTASKFSLATSVIGANRVPGTSAIGSNVPVGTSAISSSFPQGQPLILTQGPCGTFFLSAGQLSTAHGQIPGSAPNQPLLFTTQSLMPIQNTVNTMPKLLLNLQPGQTMQPLTLIQQHPVVRAKIAPKDHDYSLLQIKALTTAPLISHTPTLTSSTLTVAPTHYTPTSVSRTTTATPTPTSLSTTPTATPSCYTPTSVSRTTTATPTPTSLPTTPTATPSPYTPTQASPKKVVSKKPIAITTDSTVLAPPPPMRVVMTVGEFYYGVFIGDQSLQRQLLCKLHSSFQCKKCSFSTKSNMEMMRHYWQHTDISHCMQHEDMRCDDCYRRFSSPDLLETHQQHAHRSSPSSTVCRICEWVFDNDMEFLNHMKTNHKPGELPYVCQVCSYRSSFYSDVLQHFKCYHAGSSYLLCILCLKVTKNSNLFQQHLNKHKLKEAHPCVKCRLLFIHPKDVLDHKQQHHRSFRRPHQLSGLPPGAMVTIKTTGVNNKSLPLPSRFNSTTTLFKPTANEPIESGPPDPTLPGSAPNILPLPGLSENDQVKGVVELLCMECGTKTSEFSSHYPTFVSCLLCPYSTFCSCAYASHMIRNHIPSREKNRALPLHQRPPPCCFELKCMQCDFVSLVGDKMAEHLVLNPGHILSACRPRTTLKEPDIEFTLQGVTQQNPLLLTTTTTATTPDPSLPPWTRITGADPASVRPVRLGRFKQDRGPLHALPKGADAMEYFLLTYPEALLELIAKETNAHVKTCQYLGVPSPQWTPLGIPELKAFLGLVILMGVHGLPDMSQYWSLTQRDSDTFDRAMSLRRFKQIAANIRMGSLVTDEYRGGGHPEDLLHILRPMLDILGQAMWKAYRPNCNLTIDRTLLPALQDEAGRRMITYRQTLPEIWLLCDSKSGYCHRLSIHTRESMEHGLVGLQVVPRLMEGLEGKNHRLYLANSLASPRLMCQLLSQGIYASSSFPILSPVLPKQLWQEGNLTTPGHYLQWQCGPLLATRWRDAKEMGCLCTNSCHGRPDKVWRRSQTQAGKLDPLERPMAFRLLQENMRGVDICKQLLACNPLGGVPQDRHWRSLFWFLLNLSVVNSFIVLRESRKNNPPAWVQSGLFSQLNFRRCLGTQLAQCYRRPPDTPAPTSGGEGEEEAVAGDPLKEMHRMTKISFRTKRCKNCNGKHARQESMYGCVVCKANLCDQASCFWEYHGLFPLTKVCTKIGFVRDKISGDIELEGKVIKTGVFGNHMGQLGFSEEEDEEEDEDEIMEEAADQLRYTFRPEDEDKEFLEGKAGAPNEKEEAAAAMVVDSTPAEGTREQGGKVLSARQLRVSLVALCGGLQQAACEFFVDTAQVGTWVREAGQRWSLVGGNGPVPGEGHMVEWVWSMREQQLPITESSLFQHAATLKKNGVFSEAFRISYDWAVGLMLRHRLGLPSPCRIPAPHPPLPRLMEDGIQSFTEFTRKQVEFNRIPLSAVAGVVRLSVFLDLDMMRNSSEATWRTHDLRLSGTGLPLMTAYLAVLADGTLLPTLVLLRDPSRAEGPLKEEGPLREGPPSDPPSVLVETHPHGFSSAEGLELWVMRVWRPHASSPGQPRKRLLVLDRHRDHVAEQFLFALGQTRTLPVLIPAGCSLRLQPLRVVTLPILQRFLLTRWEQFTADQGLQEGGGCGGNLAASVPHMLTDWLKDALVILQDRPWLLKASFRLTGLVDEEGEEAPSRSQLISSLAEDMLGPGVLEPEEPAEPVPMETGEPEEREGALETEKPIEKECLNQGDGGEGGPSKEQTAGTSSKSGEQGELENRREEEL